MHVCTKTQDDGMIVHRLLAALLVQDPGDAEEALRTLKDYCASEPSIAYSSDIPQYEGKIKKVGFEHFLCVSKCIESSRLCFKEDMLLLYGLDQIDMPYSALPQHYLPSTPFAASPGTFSAEEGSVLQLVVVAALSRFCPQSCALVAAMVDTTSSFVSLDPQ